MPDAPSAQTVLVVDDEPNVRRITKLLLEREGHRVLTAADGEEALLLAKVEQPDVILLDVVMPKLDGYETLKRLRVDADLQSIPVVMVTARGTEHDIATSFRLGAIFHIEKPYETQDLLQKLQVALRRPDQA